jgi:DNA-binding winged helix-turn-helix (wHTH) protein
VHRDVLVASLWPDVDEEAALRSLQVAISSLRSVLGGRARSRSTLLARNGESYCLQLPPAAAATCSTSTRGSRTPAPAGTTATPRPSGRRWRRHSGTTG